VPEETEETVFQYLDRHYTTMVKEIGKGERMKI